MKTIARKALDALMHIYGSVSKRYYAEDFVRVYPDGIRVNRLGRLVAATANDVKNFLNHQKFYLFAGQFAKNKAVADIGSGSGHGCKLLKDAGAARVHGADASTHAIGFARDYYGSFAEFSVQGITELNWFTDEQFDLVVCSEVLEHIKEYGKQDEAVNELKRITRPGGVVVIGTPNNELLPDHGFSFEEIDALMKKHFVDYCIFENAFMPLGPSRQSFERRLKEGRTGVIVSQAIDLDETVIVNGVVPELKKGQPAGFHPVGRLNVNTALLHNTHSWAIVSIKDEHPR